MQRLEAFDCLNKQRKEILRFLVGKELDLGEITDQVGKGRATNFYHLGVLTEAGLIAKKEVLKKNWGKKAQEQHRKVVRYQLTPLGKEAIEYFSFQRSGD